MIWRLVDVLVKKYRTWRFCHEIVDWKRLSESGAKCGIVGCDQQPLTACKLGCLNHYCDEHLKIHAHVVGPWPPKDLVMTGEFYGR